MNQAVKRFLDEMGAIYAEENDRDISPILFKADDENGGKIFELTLPKGEPHPYWRVREREMTSDEVAALIEKKMQHMKLFGTAWGVCFILPDTQYKVRGYVYNARQRNKWNFSVDLKVI